MWQNSHTDEMSGGENNALSSSTMTIPPKCWMIYRAVVAIDKDKTHHMDQTAPHYFGLDTDAFGWDRKKPCSNKLQNATSPTCS